MSDLILGVEDLRVVLDTPVGALRAVDGVDLELRRGETYALVGESGCGKSMTALAIMRLLPGAGRLGGGRVMLHGRGGDVLDLGALPEAEMRDVRGRRIAMIFQEPATSLNPVLTIGRQIIEVLLRHGTGGGAPRQRAIDLLESVGVPDAGRRIDEYPFQLSGGLKQRAMIAMALAGEPELLIADEPTTALDVTIQAQVLDLLADIQRRTGMAVLMITHDLGVVARMAQRVAVMYAGEIVESAPARTFFAAPRHPYTRKLFDSLPGSARRGAGLATIAGQVPPLTGTFAGCRFVDRCDQAFDRCRGEPPRPLGGRHMVRCHIEEGAGGGSAADATPKGAPVVVASADAPPLLQVRDLKVHFPIRRGVLRRVVAHVRAVDGVSLDISAGRTLALVGESGCGKTTVGRAILRLEHHDTGEIRFDGDDLGRLAGEALRRRRRDVQIIFQDPYASLNPRMRIEDALIEGMNALGVGGDAASRSVRIDELLSQVGLPTTARGRYPHEFSGGQRQRIAIARALAVSPRLIVCDEPTSALDVSVQAQILNLLQGLQRDLGLAYLFITHNIAVVEYLADEVAVMYLGRVVEHGPVDAVLKAPRHPYTRALLSAVPRVESDTGEAQGEGGPVIRLQGEQPSPVTPPPGCHFHPRCPEARPECAQRYPERVDLGGGHAVNCMFARPGGA